MADLSSLHTFLDDDGGFDTPPMPSPAYPKGRVYRVPSPDATTGLRLAALQDLALKQSMGNAVTEVDVKRLRLGDEEERDFIGQVLSQEVQAAMVEDGVRWEHMRRMALYGYILFTAGEKAAEAAVEGGLLAGKAPAAPNRAARRTAGKGTGTSGASPASSKRRPARGASEG